MKSLTVWHGRSTRPSLPVGTARKANGSLLHGRRSRLITPPAKKSRAFPMGNALLYISLLFVVFGRVRPFRAHPVFVLPQFIYREQLHCSPVPHYQQWQRRRWAEQCIGRFFQRSDQSVFPLCYSHDPAWSTVLFRHRRTADTPLRPLLDSKKV